MYDYDPLWATMREKKISTYVLLKEHGFSKGTLDSLKQGKNVTMNTIDWLCQVLEVPVEKIVHVEIEDKNVQKEQDARISAYKNEIKDTFER